MHLLVGCFVIAYNLDKFVLWVVVGGILFWQHTMALRRTHTYYHVHHQHQIAQDIGFSLVGLALAMACRYIFGRPIGGVNKERGGFFRSLFDGQNSRARSELIVTIAILLVGLYGYHDEIIASALAHPDMYPIGAIRCLLFTLGIYYVAFILEHQWFEWTWLNDDRVRTLSAAEPTETEKIDRISKELDTEWRDGEQSLSRWLLGQATIVAICISIDIVARQSSRSNIIFSMLLLGYLALVFLFKRVTASKKQGQSQPLSWRSVSSSGGVERNGTISL